MNPIHFTEARPGPADWGACEDAQALVAATLTLMTAYAHGGETAERASAASQVAHNLQRLSRLGGSNPDFSRLCARLQKLWLVRRG